MRVLLVENLPHDLVQALTVLPRAFGIAGTARVNYT